MGKSDLKLLGLRASPFVNRVQFALNLKSLDYEFITENLPNKSELLLKSNPIHKKIPVLIHGDKPICESLVIVQYIDELWSDGPSILPADPYDRAIARFWAAYIDDKWFPALRQFRYSEGESRGELLEKLVEGVALLEDAFVKSCSKGKSFFGGENVGFLDLAFGCHLGWLRAVETIANVKILDKTKAPALAEWTERFTSHKAVKGTLPEPEELVNHHNKMMQAKAAAASQASK
ncbi:OLC1v1028084C1 [Oldenlandia corymbosa var. corymbosa]|uniref:Glutathione S-transferase n=1 Tax=Oldenlandia corymbosa var. corymbosa TaxID=529605 RepID=A0AAV1CDT8_OLDCO|nr:OLC1v1028084C1 [Oldenlandia corymbosa var. corymbosa]